MANSYATDLELMDRIGIDLNDARRGAIGDVLEAASRWIDRTTGHRFYATTETRYYTLCYPYHNGGTRLEVDDILSVASLTTDNNGDGIFETTWTAGTDFWLSPRNAPADLKPYTTINRTMLTGRFYFPAYEEAIAVNGSFGYCTLANRPTPIRELCLMVAGHLSGVTSGVTSGSGNLAIAGVQEYSIGTELSVKMQTAADLLSMLELPASASRIIDLYRKTSFVV